MMDLQNMNRPFSLDMMEMNPDEALRQRFGDVYNVSVLCAKLEHMNRALIQLVNSLKIELPELEVAVWMAVYLSDVASGLVKETRRLVESLRAQLNADSTPSDSD